MKQFQEQIILVSGQMIPNVTPVMDSRYRPQRITLCVSDGMEKNAQILEQYFKKQRIPTEIFKIGNAWDYEKLQESFMELALARWNCRDEVAVNLTGGTKLMTIAASQELNSMYRFYVTDFNKILPIMTQKEAPEIIQSTMKLNDFFAIHGVEVKNKTTRKNISSTERALFEYLFNDPKAHAESIPILNSLAAKGSERQLRVHADAGIPDTMYPLLDKFSEAGKISYYDDRTLEFTNEQARRYCNGTWLEDYVYLQLTQLDKEKKLQDFACSVEISGQSDAKNEIDAAFVYNNALYLIECKTAKMQERATDILYKLDSIQDIPGMLTKILLVSYLPLDQYDKKRAKELRVEVYDGALTKDLAHQLAAKVKKAE